MDVSQLEQILANLCSNARDAMAGKGQMTVAADNVHWTAADSRAHAGPSPGDYVRLVVSDHGCGIGDEARDKLFEPFFTTKELGRGTGLGLAIVYGIVQQNNGFITVHSEPDRGTVFTIYLPRHAGDDGLLPPPAQVAHLVRG
jgi:signal transduction histidine kinase